MGSLRSLARPLLFDIFILRGEDGDMFLCADWRTVPNEDIEYARFCMQEKPTLELEASYSTLGDIPTDYDNGLVLLWFSDRCDWIATDHVRWLRGPKGARSIKNIRELNKKNWDKPKKI